MLMLVLMRMMGATMPRKTKTARLVTRETAATTPATIRFSRIANIVVFFLSDFLLNFSYLVQKFELYFSHICIAFLQRDGCLQRSASPGLQTSLSLFSSDFSLFIAKHKNWIVINWLKTRQHCIVSKLSHATLYGNQICWAELGCEDPYSCLGLVLRWTFS